MEEHHMEIPSLQDRIWTDLLTKESLCEFEFLALKLLLNRLKIQVRYDQSTIQEAAAELRGMFEKFDSLPKIQGDLQRLLQKPSSPAAVPAKVEPAAAKAELSRQSGALYDFEQVSRMIEEGKKLVLAGDEKLLSRLPLGHWIGGSIPYFVTEQGGVMSREKIHVSEIPRYVKRTMIKSYGPQTVTSVFSDMPENGFSIIIIPASSGAHMKFALEAPFHRDFARGPLIGWIAGVHVDDIGRAQARVFFGDNSKSMADGAVAMHLTLADEYYADLNIVNIFRPGSGDVLTFERDGFRVRDVLVNGKKRNFAEYIEERGMDTRLPLVANYSGAMINISFQGVNASERAVDFYAPVFRGVEYRHAAPVGNYVNEFLSRVPKQGAESIFFSCNCILNYLYSELEGKKLGNITGPTTFGEIAHQLLNQTLAYLTVHAR
jgi:hypothetical protein